MEMVKLDKLCSVRTGRKDVNQGNPDGEYPFFTCAKNHTFCDDFSFEGEALLIAGNGDVGNVSYFKGKFEAYQRTYVLMDFENVSARYLYHILSGTLKSELFDRKLGNTMPYIKKGMLTEFAIPLPPLSEQRRIVGILDEAFAGIDKIIANTEQNLSNARELFESYLNNAFTQKSDGVMQPWATISISDACSVFTDGDWIESKDQSPTGIRLVQTGNVGIGRFKNRQQKARFINAHTFSRLKCKEIFPGDCLVSRLPDPVGRACVVPEVKEQMITAVDCSILRFDPDFLNSDFFVYYSQSRAYQANIESACTGATRKRISRKNLGKISVPKPPLSEQKRIATALDRISAETRRLEVLYQQKLDALNELKQSILHKAFSGDLPGKEAAA